MITKPRLLIIDDDYGLLTLLRISLTREGYEVTTAADGREGLRQAYECHPDLVILDIMMPEMDGWAVCQRLRQVTDVPIIILTAIVDSSSVVSGLSLGADDYITKPCSFDVLKARILTSLRHRATTAESDPDTVFDDGHLSVDLVRQVVILGGHAVNLTPTELRLLLYLVRHRNRIVPHKELLTHVWGPEYADETKYLGVYVRYLREKIEGDPSHPSYIVTKHRVGYTFVG